jgi:hypothetical protein
MLVITEYSNNGRIDLELYSSKGKCWIGSGSTLEKALADVDKITKPHKVLAVIPEVAKKKDLRNLNQTHPELFI